MKQIVSISLGNSKDDYEFVADYSQELCGDTLICVLSLYKQAEIVLV